MPGFMPGISLRRALCQTIGMAGTSPAMTANGGCRYDSLRAHAGGFNHLFRHFAILHDLGGERVGRIGDADE